MLMRPFTSAYQSLMYRKCLQRCLFGTRLLHPNQTTKARVMFSSYRNCSGRTILSPNKYACERHFVENIIVICFVRRLGVLFKCVCVYKVSVVCLLVCISLCVSILFCSTEKVTHYLFCLQQTNGTEPTQNTLTHSSTYAIVRKWPPNGTMEERERLWFRSRWFKSISITLYTLRCHNEFAWVSECN